MQQNDEDLSRINYEIIDKLCVYNQQTLEEIQNGIDVSAKLKTQGIACLSAAMATLGMAALVEQINPVVGLGIFGLNVGVGIAKAVEMYITKSNAASTTSDFVSNNIKDLLAMNTNPITIDFNDENGEIVDGSDPELLYNMYIQSNEIQPDDTDESRLAKSMISNELNERLSRNVYQLLEENKSRIDMEIDR